MEELNTIMDYGLTVKEIIQMNMVERENIMKHCTSNHFLCTK